MLPDLPRQELRSGRSVQQLVSNNQTRTSTLQTLELQPPMLLLPACKQERMCSQTAVTTRQGSSQGCVFKLTLK